MHPKVSECGTEEWLAHAGSDPDSTGCVQCHHQECHGDEDDGVGVLTQNSQWQK